MSTTSQASQRINTLLDENSFVEIGALVTARATDFNLNRQKLLLTVSLPVMELSTAILCMFTARTLPY